MGMKWRALTEDERQLVIANYHEYSSTQLATIVGCEAEQIRYIWKRASLRGKRPLRRHCDNQYFSAIDAPEKAYFLGFIAADGCVHATPAGKWLCLAVAIEDEPLLVMLRDSLMSDSTISEFSRRLMSGREATYRQIHIASDQLCDDLATYGITPRKTHTYYPVNVPVSYMAHFIRGYFDGDGSMHIFRGEGQAPSNYRVSIAANEQTAAFLHNQLDVMGVHSIVEKHSTKDIYYVIIKRIDSIARFVQHLYDGIDGPCLSRKKAVADRYMQVYYEKRRRMNRS